MMGELLAGLAAADVDYVLVDCPPVLPVSDPLAVAQYVDGVILLAVVGQTRIHSLAEAHERLTKVGAEVLGIVLNGVPTARGRYPYYYYRRFDQYGYSSTSTDVDLPENPSSAATHPAPDAPDAVTGFRGTPAPMPTAIVQRN
jgi:Mrp family chromosome partitioning ATPase